MLEHAVGRIREAAALEAAVEHALEEAPTADLAGSAMTEEFTDAVLGALTGADAVRTL